MDEFERAEKARHQSPYLTVWETAVYLRISERALRYYRRSGSGPKYQRNAKRILYHIDDIIAWAEARSRTGVK